MSETIEQSKEDLPILLLGISIQLSDAFELVSKLEGPFCETRDSIVKAKALVDKAHNSAKRL